MKAYNELITDIKSEQVKIAAKINKLAYFMMTEDFQKISIHQQTLLTQQLAAMNNYSGCLVARAVQINFEHALEVEKTCMPKPEKNCLTCIHRETERCAIRRKDCQNGNSCWEGE